MAKPERLESLPRIVCVATSAYGLMTIVYIYVCIITLKVKCIAKGTYLEIRKRVGKVRLCSCQTLQL